MKKLRGQLSIEFLLIASFLLSLAAVLLNTAQDQLRQTDALDNAALSKAAAESLSTLVNTAVLHGNGTQLMAQIYVPPSSVCFFVNTTDPTRKSLECDPDPSINGRVYSHYLYTSNVTLDSSCPPSSTSGGWYQVTVSNSKNWITITCSKTV